MAAPGIGDAARAALKDLRLVIDSMDDIGGDLMLALGSWRERAMAQLRPHDIALDWRAVTAAGPAGASRTAAVACHPDRAAAGRGRDQRRQACRCAAHHGEDRDARRRRWPRSQGCITVEDDGKGFEIASDGAAADGAIKSGARPAQHAKPRGALWRGAGPELLRPSDCRVKGLIKARA